ncbi:SUMF1/EgtB/PvdO family nonheme iron enzyme [Bradyrhizobium sp. B097]|uniref:SUMF1/EgtB/PvdO family nonheme iron enzyme n=1 Tax=Bradyrhizobium sp. B097 TaxID=3140244 RepID=UPI00318417A1
MPDHDGRTCLDAHDGYAAWISLKTGVTHRLPTDEEWTFAAAKKARDEALPRVDPADPAQAWIARYEAESNCSKPAETAPQPGGTFGTNSKGFDDLAGNIWEWTKYLLHPRLVGWEPRAGDERQLRRTIVERAHRAYMTDFIRDPKSGGCAVGFRRRTWASV